MGYFVKKPGFKQNMTKSVFLLVFLFFITIITLTTDIDYDIICLFEYLCLRKISCINTYVCNHFQMNKNPCSHAVGTSGFDLTIFKNVP